MQEPFLFHHKKGKISSLSKANRKVRFGTFTPLDTLAQSETKKYASRQQKRSIIVHGKGVDLNDWFERQSNVAESGKAKTDFSNPESNFLTLTIKSIKQERLRALMKNMLKGLKRIIATYRKRHCRGKGIRLMGIRSLECEFKSKEANIQSSFSYGRF